MPADRLLPTTEAEELLAMVRRVAAAELEPVAGEHEAGPKFPREVFRMLGGLGLLGLPYPEEYGGGAQPQEVYLQVLDELGHAWMSVAVGVSVHVLSAYPLATFGTDEQRARWLPAIVGGDLLGAYCLSEVQAGSDVAGMRCAARRDGDHYVISGSKAWITHGGEADFYTVFARTGEHPTRGISCFLVEAAAPGLSFGAPEPKLGLNGSTTAQVHFDDVAVEADRRIGDDGAGFRIAMSALDGGRLGIAASATGLAQAALDVAVDYAREREQFGRPIAEFQGLSFLLADMAAAVESSRATYLQAARRRDRGLPYSQEASIAKLVATDAAMRVTTDAVQVLGGFGYTRYAPAERFMREAKVTQIFEGTNQIQRMVIGRRLTGDR
jgi:alkylation response protein AidB-like acyl-CoA dehydrogenase